MANKRNGKKTRKQKRNELSWLQEKLTTDPDKVRCPEMVFGVKPECKKCQHKDWHDPVGNCKSLDSGCQKNHITKTGCNGCLNRKGTEELLNGCTEQDEVASVVISPTGDRKVLDTSDWDD